MERYEEKSKITKQLLYINRLCNNQKWAQAKILVNQISDTKGTNFDLMTKNDFKLYYYIQRKVAFHA